MSPSVDGVVANAKGGEAGVKVDDANLPPLFIPPFRLLQVPPLLVDSATN